MKKSLKVLSTRKVINRVVPWVVASTIGWSGLAQASSGDLLDPEIQTLKSIIDAGLNVGNCDAELARVASVVQSIKPETLPISRMKGQGFEVAVALRTERLKLQNQLDQMSAQCRKTSRTSILKLRELEDYLEDIAFAGPRIKPGTIDFQAQPIPIKNTEFYKSHSIGPAFKDAQVDFQPGDIFLTRGVSFLSATITQVTDTSSPFSHVVFVDKDPVTGKLVTYESYFAEGVSLYEGDFALKNENARILWLRPKDRTLGQKAAEFFRKVYADNLRKGLKIQYDYNMQFADFQRLSCIEIALFSYLKGAGVQIPEIANSVTIPNAAFLQALNLKNGPIPTPGDFETDPRFDIVVDWKDTRLLRDSRYKDAALLELVRWAKELKYEFRTTPKAFFIKNILVPLRSTSLWPFVRKITGSPQIDPTTPPQMLASMAVLMNVGEVLLERIEKDDAAFIKQMGRPMTNKELRSALDKYRQQDKQDYTEGYSEFHSAFRPDGLYVNRSNDK